MLQGFIGELSEFGQLFVLEFSELPRRCPRCIVTGATDRGDEANVDTTAKVAVQRVLHKTRFGGGATVWEQAKLDGKVDDIDGAALRIFEFYTCCSLENRNSVLGRGVVKEVDTNSKLDSRDGNVVADRIEERAPLLEARC